MLAIGGYQYDDRYTIGLLYDPLAARWSSATPPAQTQPIRALLALNDGRVLAIHESPAPPELYDPASDSWAKTGMRVSARADDFGCATMLADGRVLLTAADASAELPNWGEIYDPVSGSWTATGAMREARRGYSTTLLADGQVLVAGGINPHSATFSAEVFYPTGLP